MANIKSMTAFARHVEQSDSSDSTWANITWELKSVNHRYLDISIRLPEKLRYLENDLRARLRQSLARGKVELTLRVEEQANETLAVEVDENLVRALNEAREKIELILVASKPVAAADVMKWPGVIRAKALDFEKLEQPVQASFEHLLNSFIESRAREGEALEQMIQQRLDKIDGFIKIFRKNLPETLANHRAKLQTRLMQILDKQREQVDQDRLEQELVLFAQKIDIEEELDRLEAHVKEVKRILDEGGAVGRQLDFLMQELNREANTTGSKSANAEQSQAVVDLKVLIEQMREQIQNIE